MAGLEDLFPTSPDNNDPLSQGDDAIRLIVTKLLEFAAIEHALTGEHKFGIGAIATRPAAGFPGRFYILTVAGVAPELQYDTGAAWVTLTSNQSLLNYATALSEHAGTAILAHPDQSVTAAKIKSGAILKKHLMGGVSVDSIAALVNGGVADPLHSHANESQAGVTGFTEYLTAGAHIVGVPESVYRMIFSAIGGGGAGGSGSYRSGGGGGASGTIVWNHPLIVIPEADIDIYVGNGGLGNNNENATGDNGEDSTVEGLPFDALGGRGGGGAYLSTGTGDRTGGVARIGMIPSYSGGRGSYHPFEGTYQESLPGGSSAWYNGGSISNQSGGGGAASIFGPGKNGGGNGGNGTSAASGTGAGGGGGGQNKNTWGGNGGSGRILVFW